MVMYLLQFVHVDLVMLFGKPLDVDHSEGGTDSGCNQVAYDNPVWPLE
jgi:hypothetical protein